MIKIVNKKLNSTMVVTKGAYDNLYESLGYEIVKDEKKPLERKAEDNKEPIKLDTKGEREKFSRKKV